jgi:hypothetical protein
MDTMGTPAPIPTPVMALHRGLVHTGDAVKLVFNHLLFLRVGFWMVLPAPWYVWLSYGRTCLSYQEGRF